MEHISVTELAAWINDPERPTPLLLDVREPWEHQTCHIAGSQLVPMNTIPGRFSELEEDQPVVCICHHGGRSMQVANFLLSHGFTQLVNVSGGIHAWSAEVDNSIPTY